jgi:hypothetical protein
LTGVEEEVLIVQVLEKVGLPEDGLKEDVAPEGSPDADRLTLCVEPPVKVTVTIFEPEPPCVTVIPTLLLKLKSNEGGLLTVGPE